MLALPGCGDADRDLPREYRRMTVRDDRLSAERPRTRPRGVPHELRDLSTASGAMVSGCAVKGSSDSRATSPMRCARIDVAAARRVRDREGSAQTSMPAWPTLTDDEVWDVTAFVLSLGERR